MTGDPIRTAEDIRRVSRIDENGCWLWTRSTRRGYGAAWDPRTRRIISAHRLSYELLVGPIPKGLQIDHLCRVRNCVNPDHLEAVTQRENVLRGVGRTAQNAAKTHCIRGHEFTPENTIVRASGRGCRACQREQRQNLRAAAVAG